jgi:drug/metabolite transporter (DMT)-like permease
VFNSILAHYIFKQHLTIKTSLGIGVIIIGVVWISVAKNSNYQVEEVIVDETEIFKNRILAISAALVASFVSSLRPIQAKWVSIYNKYHPYDFTIDSGFITGIVLLILFSFGWLSDAEGYNFNNSMASLAGSTLTMFWGITGLNASVKGPQAPTQAVMQVHSIFSIILAAIFFDFIPKI